MFAITPDSVFKINSYAYIAMATSSTACGLGIACDLWFLVRYNWVDSETFIVRTSLLTKSQRTLTLLLAVVSLSWCIWFTRLLLLVFTFAHLLPFVVYHLPNGPLGDHCIPCMAHRCPCDWGVGDLDDGPPVSPVWDVSMCCVHIARLERFPCIMLLGASEIFPVMGSRNFLSIWWVSFHPSQFPANWCSAMFHSPSIWPSFSSERLFWILAIHWVAFPPARTLSSKEQNLYYKANSRW